ncbi:DUF3322 domain-containing protein [Micromonospora sp. 4G55]|uniref:DUF3322 domain-containing protein n=1 Tax=Micromonospora sp. 4G55 TaxID=2806102 RepID=UPI001A50C4AC|nr:DUF3322 domain-containing protein [Micromonospora sp. 4G55]MBM0255558.1 hypothetical protein [Micromonospora sp. 4G55]
MKTIEQVLTDIERRLSNTWASYITDTLGITLPPAAAADDGAVPTTPAPSEQPGPRAASWPHDFPLGQPTSPNLAKDFATAATWAASWRSWSAAHDTPLRTRTRRVHNTDQELPTHLVVTDPDHAARLCARHWPQRLERARQRANLLTDRFPHLAEAGPLAATITAVDELSETDFELLCRAGTWFAEHDATGLTPRQVPIEGLHAKWLNHRLELVRRLSARERLETPATTSTTSALHLPRPRPPRRRRTPA